MDEQTNKAAFPIKDVAQICIIVPYLDEAVKNFWNVFGIEVHVAPKPRISAQYDNSQDRSRCSKARNSKAKEDQE